MNVEIGTEAAQFPQKKYLNGIFLAVCFRNRNVYVHCKKKLSFLPSPARMPLTLAGNNLIIPGQGEFG